MILNIRKCIPLIVSFSDTVQRMQPISEMILKISQKHLLHKVFFIFENKSKSHGPTSCKLRGDDEVSPVYSILFSHDIAMALSYRTMI